MSGYTSETASVISGDETDGDFDWDAGSEDEDKDEDEEKRVGGARGKRGRWVYQRCMALPRGIRTLMMIVVGVIPCMIPIIVVEAAFEDYSRRGDVVAWCAWFAIIWATTCATFFVVDIVAAILVQIAIALYGKAPGLIKRWIEILIGTALYVKIVLSASWAWISLGGILGVTYRSVDNRPGYWHWINSVIQAIFCGSIVLLVEKVLVQLVALDFHATAVKDRLEDNQKALKILDTLYDAVRTGAFGHFKAHARGLSTPLRSRPGTPGGTIPVTASPSAQGAVEANASGLGETPTETTTPNSKRKTLAKNFSQAPGKAARGAAKTAKESAQRARKAKVVAQLNDMVSLTTLSQKRLYKSKWASQESARKLAKKIFLRLGQNRKYLTPEDFVPYFRTPTEAQEAFAVFDRDGNGDIDRGEMRSAVQRIYRERRALNAGLKDISQAMSKLDNVLLVVALVICIFLWLLIFNHSKNISSIMPMTTFIVSFSFVFGNSLKNVFESMVFIFGTHPYDAGDLVQIDGSWQWVKEFGLLSTTFATVLNETVIAPNSLLATSKYIYNARRSGQMWETTTVYVSYTTTTLSSIEVFRAKLRQFVKENDREYGGGLDVNFDQITNQNLVALTVAFEHTRGAFQDWGARWDRRTKLMKYIRELCLELGFQYEAVPQPIRFMPQPNSGLRGMGRGPTQVTQPVGLAPQPSFSGRAPFSAARR